MGKREFMTFDKHTAYVRRLVEQGGPREAEYGEFDAWTIRINDAVRHGQISSVELASLRSAFGEVLTPATLAGFAFTKPHGYAGDYEIIDRIYRNHISHDPRFTHWDRHWQPRPATQAVRNRKTYFHKILDKHYKRHSPLRVLKVATGPGRSMFEWLSANPKASVTFDCIEIDPAAIRYASDLNQPFQDRITFIQKNIELIAILIIVISLIPAAIEWMRARKEERGAAA